MCLGTSENDSSRVKTAQRNQEIILVVLHHQHERLVCVRCVMSQKIKLSSLASN